MLSPQNLRVASKGPWKPGQSGNPAGRRTERERYGDVDIASLARSHAVDAMKTLVLCLRDERYKLAAACAILDRGYGKPMQSIHTQSEQTVLHLVAAQATQILEAVAPQTIEHQPDEQPKE